MPLTAVVFLVGFITGCVLAFVRHPVYGLMTYIATLYLDPAGQWWGHALLPHFRWELLPAVVTLLAMAVQGGRAPSPLFRTGLFAGICIVLAWLVIQTPWVVNLPAQERLLTIWSKFLLVSIMICSCVDSWKHLKLVLWSNVIGCVYMGWIAHALYHGGRFQGFGLGSITEANAAALVLVVGFLGAGSLFLAGNRTSKILLLIGMAFIANGIITTISREGFLELICGGIAFIVFAPKGQRPRVILASIAAACCFLYLTPSDYWHRIKTIEYEGAKIQGVDTGHSRVVILRAQWQMFKEHPLGCGHACTEALSPRFIPSQYLTHGLRASHNTFMTMLVDHGIPGALLYIAYLWWTFRTIKRIAPHLRRTPGFPGAFLPGLVGIMVAIPVGDLFAQFPKLEIRIWFLSLLVACTRLLELDDKPITPALALEYTCVPEASSGSTVGVQDELIHQAIPSARNGFPALSH
jgi:hypothetical protein